MLRRAAAETTTVGGTPLSSSGYHEDAIHRFVNSRSSTPPHCHAKTFWYDPLDSVQNYLRLLNSFESLLRLA